MLKVVASPKEEDGAHSRRKCHLPDITFIKDPLQSKLYRTFFRKAQDRYANNLLGKDRAYQRLCISAQAVFS